METALGSRPDSTPEPQCDLGPNTSVLHISCVSIQGPSYFILEIMGSVLPNSDQDLGGLPPWRQVGLSGARRSKKGLGGQNRGEATCTVAQDVGVREPGLGF